MTTSDLCKGILVLIIVPAVLVQLAGAICYGTNEVSEDRMVGGSCKYESYPGRATIVSINEVAQPATSSEKRYEVRFTFIPDKEVEQTFAQTEGRDFLLLLKDNSYPTQAFLSKYEINLGKEFISVMKVITKGTCTPIMFEFSTIRLDDYSK